MQSHPLFQIKISDTLNMAKLMREQDVFQSTRTGGGKSLCYRGFPSVLSVLSFVGFPTVILKNIENRKIRLSSLQESIIMLSIFPLAIRVLPNHMYIHKK